MGKASISNEELLVLIKTGESDRVERKESRLNAAETRKTLVAFANSLHVSEYAVLFIGVRNDGTIKGITDSDEAQKQILKTAAEECYPPIECSIKLLDVDGHEVVAVIIPHSNSLPHFTGPAYVRTGSVSEKASEKCFKELINKHHSKARKLIEHKGKHVLVELRCPTPYQVPILLPQVHDRDYVIHDCSPHELQLIEWGRQKNVSVPLDCVQICSTTVAGKSLRLIIDEHNPERFAL